MATMPRRMILLALVSLMIFSSYSAEAADPGSASNADGVSSPQDSGTDSVNQEDGSTDDAEVIRAAPTKAPTTNEPELPVIESELIVLGH
ncbi:Lipid-A-disaccharide synthase [Psidium guajava]|nr:Lipid-A-disaccharide synthase [Psidium guajava]